MGTDVNDRAGIFIVDVESGKTTLVAGNTPTDYYSAPRWSADQRKVYLYHRIGASRPYGGGLVERDLVTRQERLLFEAKDYSYPRMSNDGTKIYFVTEPSTRGADGRAQVGDYRLMERTVATGAERELARRPAPYGLRASPDGRQILITGKDAEAFKKDPWTRISVMGVVSSSGGPIRLIQSGCPEGRVNSGTWARDSASILVRCGNPVEAGALEHFWVPLDGREPRRLSELSVASGEFAANPRTDEIAFVAGGPSRPHEIHVISNALASPARKR